MLSQKENQMAAPTREAVMRLSSRAVIMLWQAVIEDRALRRHWLRDSRWWAVRSG